MQNEKCKMQNHGASLLSERAMPLLCQGTSNGCGTTCLAMVLSHLAGISYSREEIDSRIRKWNIYTAPGDMLQYARRMGFHSEAYNHGTIRELMTYLTDGIPLIALLRVPRGLHYVVLTGWQEVQNAISFEVRDPSSGSKSLWRAEAFENQWRRIPGPLSNFYMAFSRPDHPLPPSRIDGVRALLFLINTFARIANKMRA